MVMSQAVRFSQLRQYFEFSCDKYPNRIALQGDGFSFTYETLEQEANRLANYLIAKGINESSRVAIFLERSVASYISILAVLKTGAAYIPVDVEYPDERVNYIFQDMHFHAVLTSKLQIARKAVEFPETLVLDDLQHEINQQPESRPALRGEGGQQLCYVIYTSGTTGKPKGVEIPHSSICHYVAVASQVYGIQAEDKIYQGFSLSFDASLEEVWMAFANGATLVACFSKEIRSGLGLIEFLNHFKVTCLSTVPTLLTTLEPQLPHLRLLILGGEACNMGLVNTWSREGLRIINSYGPTEATVIATYSECSANVPVTIGKPLPGYTCVVLDEQLQQVLPGEQGELCIGGEALALGYVNQPEQTANKFISHPQDPQKRLYRTGDLVRFNEVQDLEFLGRIDDQVKLRGFRIELHEIEQVILSYAGVKQVAVAVQELDGPALVAYLQLNKQDAFDWVDFKQTILQKLPYYMVPAIYQELEVFPVLASGKINRKALPKPEIKPLPDEEIIAPVTPLEIEISQVWQEEFKCASLSVTSDFFYDLGGHSLSAAKVISKLRKVRGLHNLSILDLYQNPTIQQLAAKLEQTETAAPVEQKKAKHKAGKLGFGLCALGQFFGWIFQYALSAWQVLAAVLFFHWMAEIKATPTEYMTSLLMLITFLPLALMFFTVSAKWMLIGKIKPGQYRLWGWFYLRWWLVHRLQQTVFNPKHLIGTPLINVYYRMLGARIGRNSYIGTSSVAVPDVLEIGENTSIGYDARIAGYIVEDGWLKIGSVVMGSHCYVGARAVIGINTILEDKAVLDEMSMLPAGSLVSQGKFYSGSPAREQTASAQHMTRTNKSIDETDEVTNFAYGLLHYLAMAGLMTVHYGCYYPSFMIMAWFFKHGALGTAIVLGLPLSALSYHLALYSSIILGKRLLLPEVKTGVLKLKSLYYLRQWLVVKMLDDDAVYVMADSLYLPRFMRLMGANLGKSVEMGEAPHLLPDLLTIKDQGFAASSVAFAWPNVYEGSIRFMPVTVSKKAFLGNVSFMPQGKTLGEGGLLGCMSTTPLDNRAETQNTAWLGSPAVFLPKREIVTGFSDEQLYNPSKKVYAARMMIELLRILAPTMLSLGGFFLFYSWMKYLLANYPLKETMLLLPLGELGIICALVGLVIGLKWVILGRLKPATKPIWDLFIRKLDLIEYMYSYFINIYMTNYILGSPMVSVLYRCLGARIGKRVFIETSQFAEFDLISIQDETCLNAETLIDTHLYEDRIFKMSRIEVGKGCNVGIGSVILYDTVMHPGSSLGSLSLLMKGESLSAHTHWQGAPAQPLAGEDDLGVAAVTDVTVKESLLPEV